MTARPSGPRVPQERSPFAHLPIPRSDTGTPGELPATAESAGPQSQLRPPTPGSGEQPASSQTLGPRGGVSTHRRLRTGRGRAAGKLHARPGRARCARTPRSPRGRGRRRVSHPAPPRPRFGDVRRPVGQWAPRAGAQRVLRGIVMRPRAARSPIHKK